MSHNLYTINNEGGTVLSYHGFNDGVIYIGRGESVAYGGGTNINDKVEFYDSSPINTISGASFNTVTRAGGDFIESVTLPAGTYYSTATQNWQVTSSGGVQWIFALQQLDTSTLVESNIPGGAFSAPSSVQVNNAKADFLVESNIVFSLTAEHKIFFKFSFKFGTPTYTASSTRNAESNYWFIRKLS